MDLDGNAVGTAVSIAAEDTLRPAVQTLTRRNRRQDVLDGLEAAREAVARLPARSIGSAYGSPLFPFTLPM